jgi:hypothetical protein
VCVLVHSGAGFPDGIFSNQNSKFGKILESHRMENVCIFYYHLVNLRPFYIFYGHILWSSSVFYGHILWSFSIFCGHLVYFVVI